MEATTTPDDNDDLRSSNRQPKVVDGSKYINSSDHPTHDTSKKGYPIVETGTRVDCPHCNETHIADYTEDENVGLDVPGGHKRRNHFTCYNSEYNVPFAAKKGSRR